MLEVRNVKINYDHFQAVKGVSFTVREGEFFTLLGPSGCGKTTTLRAISGFEKVAEGQILLNGEDISPLSPEERDIGFVFQNYALFPTMSVFENIAFGLKIRHLKKAQIKKEVEAIANLIGIEEHLHKKISQLSGGQQQRVAIARALVLKPRLLLMDEPLSNLDAKLRISMRGEIRNLQQKLGIVAVYVTHDQEEAMAISDHIAVFHEGVIDQIGTPQEIYRHPRTTFVAQFVGDINELPAQILPPNGAFSRDATSRHFIRTEHVRILLPGDADEGAISMPGTVANVEFLGAATKTRIVLEGHAKITSMTFQNVEIRVGQKVRVAFDPQDVITI